VDIGHPDQTAGNSAAAETARQFLGAGLSNGYTTFFLSPRYGGGVYWGAGPVLYYPSATNLTVGVNTWGSGASVTFLKEASDPKSATTWLLKVTLTFQYPN